MRLNHKIKLPAFLANVQMGKPLAVIRASHPRLFVPLMFLIALILILGGFFILRGLIGSESEETYSGTIEATEYRLGAEKGGRVDRVDAREGDKVEADQVLVVVHGERLRSPIAGVVLERAIEPAEIAAAGGTLITIADLDALTLTVYVPEDRYGKIFLKQSCQVMVDSYPGEVFNGVVSHIADRAMFTPRNVQTVESRKSTVFAIRLDLEPSDGKLKPGMQADVLFQFNR